MNYKFLLILLLTLLGACKSYEVTESSKKIINKESFVSKGFALVYDDSLFKDKIIKKKLDNRSYFIFQKNLKKNTTVKITNILNNKSIIAKVDINSNYPLFNNSVISARIANEINLDVKEPYIEIFEILDNSTFIAGKAKTFDEEKNVANKAPIQNISINNLNETNEDKSKEINKDKVKKFNYNIKVADFYFKDTALDMVKKIRTISSIKNIKVDKLSKTQYRVFLGPFKNINSLQKAFNGISILEFENIEIIRND